MVKLRQGGSNGAEMVKLVIKGPRSIIPKALTVDTRMSNTWLFLLNNELKLNVRSDKGIFVCTSRYTPSAPKQGEGWRADLTEPISVYVNKFERRRKPLTARLCYSYVMNTSTTADISPPRRFRAPTPCPFGGKKETSGGTNSRCFSEPRSVYHGAMENRQPAISSSTRGNANSRSNESSQRNQQNDSYLKPRYHNANGLPPRGIPNTQQLRYCTRLRERYDQSACERSRNHNRGRSSWPRIDKVLSLGIVKVEMQPITPGSSQFYGEGEPEEDEEEMEDDYEDGNMDEDEEEEIRVPEEPPRQQRRSMANGAGGSGGSNAANVINEMMSDNDLSDDDDTASQCTTATQEDQELRRSGIVVDDIKSLAERRFSGFSNAYMLRVRSEIAKLKDNNTWMKNVKRSPLACVMLQAVFK